jgi:hypothetical protein
MAPLLVGGVELALSDPEMSQVYDPLTHKSNCDFKINSFVFLIGCSI